MKEKEKLLDILDYGLVTIRLIPLRTYQFELKHNLAFKIGNDEWKKQKIISEKY